MLKKLILSLGPSSLPPWGGRGVGIALPSRVRVGMGGVRAGRNRAAVLARIALLIPPQVPFTEGQGLVGGLRCGPCGSSCGVGGSIECGRLHSASGGALGMTGEADRVAAGVTNASSQSSSLLLRGLRAAPCPAIHKSARRRAAGCE
jgi:hypothetical protein